MWQRGLVVASAKRRGRRKRALRTRFRVLGLVLLHAQGEEAEEKGHCCEDLRFRVSKRRGRRKRILRTGVLRNYISIYIHNI
jgi:hypothetical protein